MIMASLKCFINIGALCLVPDETIAEYLFPYLKTLKINSEFIRLLPADLRSYIPPSHLDAVILLHPYTEGRLSLTNVTDARYTTLLPTLCAHFGSHRICVIAYLVRNVKESTQQTHLAMMKAMQPTVLETSNYIIICGNLKDMFPRDLLKIQQFIEESWKSTTQTPWKNEWLSKPEMLEQTGKQLKNHERIIPCQIPNTENTTNHTQHDEHDLTETANADAYLGDGTHVAYVEAEKKLESLLLKAIADSDTRSKTIRKDTVDRPKPIELEDSYDVSSTVLVTDASGFIAAHIVDQLTRLGYKVRGALDLDEGTLNSLEKGTLDNVFMAKVATLKKQFPQVVLCEAGIRHHFGWKKAVQGCTYVVHTSRFQDNKPSKEDVTKLLQACQDDKGIKRVVLTGGSEFISEKELKGKEWNNSNSALKDAICKDISEKAAKSFFETEEKPTFGLSIIKPPVVLGPILCELSEANVEIVRRRMVDASSGWFDISIPVCDVRDVAEAHIMAMNCKDAGDIHVSDGVVPQRLSLKDMAAILKREFKDQGYAFPSWSITSPRWDSMARCLSDLYGNIIKPVEQMDLGIRKSVIDMTYSCIERGFIPKMPGYRPRYQEETAGASAV